MDQPFLAQGNFDGIPNAWAGIVDAPQTHCGGGDHLQVRQQGRTSRTGFQMSLLFGGGAALGFRQAPLQLSAIHTALSPSPCQICCLSFPSACSHSKSLPSYCRIPVFAGSLSNAVLERCSRLFGFFSSISLEQVPQLHSRLV